MFSLVLIAIVVGIMGGLAISFARTAPSRRRALIGWCSLPSAFALIIVAYLGLKSGEAFATWPLLWVGMLISVPSVLFALSAGLGFWLAGWRGHPGATNFRATRELTNCTTGPPYSRGKRTKALACLRYRMGTMVSPWVLIRRPIRQAWRPSRISNSAPAPFEMS